MDLTLKSPHLPHCECKSLRSQRTLTSFNKPEACTQVSLEHSIAASCNRPASPFPVFHIRNESLGLLEGQIPPNGHRKCPLLQEVTLNPPPSPRWGCGFPSCPLSHYSPIPLLCCKIMVKLPRVLSPLPDWNVLEKRSRILLDLESGSYSRPLSLVLGSRAVMGYPP